MPYINIIGSSGSSKIALKQIEKLKPDAIILDLELSYGEGNGLTMIPEIIENSDIHKPFILITTNNPSTKIDEYAKKAGADYTFYKFQTGYSELMVLNFLLSLKNIIIKDIDNHPIPPAITDSERDKILSNEITDNLNLVGIKPSSAGFKYLKAAILYTILDINKPIFKAIAQQHNLKPQSIQRSIQYVCA